MLTDSPDKEALLAVIPGKTSRLDGRWVALAVLMVCAAVYFATSPRSGDFYWSDSSRHAMDGVFVHDFLRAMPMHSLREWASQFYLHYPAIAILYYPPVFAGVESVFYAIFGISQSTALLTVAVFVFLSGLGSYALLRRHTGEWVAIAGGVLFMAMPQNALWGRQVMLEPAAFAFLIWGAVALLRYLDTDRPGALYAATLLFCAAVYTKQTAVFVFGAALITVVVSKGWRVLGRREALLAGCVGACILLPLVIFMSRLSFLSSWANNEQWAIYPRWSWAGWLYYLRSMPLIVSWPTSVLALVAICAGAFRQHYRFPRNLQILMLVWFGTGYVFFSYMTHKEPRHFLFAAFPAAILAVKSFELLPAFKPGLVALSASGAVFATSMIAHVPEVAGYRAAADYIANHAAPNSVILFNGYRDGPFVFETRRLRERPDFYVLRADKLFLRIAAERSAGFEEMRYSESDMTEMFQRYGVEYVVADPDFWQDIQVMRQLSRVLHSPQFRQVASIPITGDVDINERQLDIYQAVGPSSSHPVPVSIDIPLIGQTVSGVVKK